MALSAGGGGTTIVKTGTSAAVMYTVPAGKTFEGHLWNSSSTGPGYINGVQLQWPYHSSYFQHAYLPISLNGGDVIKADGSGTTMLVGVER